MKKISEWYHNLPLVRIIKNKDDYYKVQWKFERLSIFWRETEDTYIILSEAEAAAKRFLRSLIEMEEAIKRRKKNKKSVIKTYSTKDVNVTV